MCVQLTVVLSMHGSLAISSLICTSGILTSLLFNVLPALLLVLYPCQFFRSCLSIYHLNFIIMYTFMDKVYSCYRNDLNGGRDMRSFSGLYPYKNVLQDLA